MNVLESRQKTMETSPLRWVEPLKRWRRFVVKMLLVIPGMMNPLAERLDNARPIELSSSSSSSDSSPIAAATSDAHNGGDDDDDQCPHHIVTRTGSNAVWVKVSCNACGYVFENRPRRAGEDAKDSPAKKRKL